ncbi:uncharacterized protein DFL_006028 [Arthrobotrys flagrans]|uniref:Protein kinase domain-containing protein n=1 Tax=Arthrobotrys flagrans TaxID=97331 RepID=A0A436ZZ23_ARTFL|nr:hypothetical protein DFL_006028 [Arthrobotrys flagrans]
MRLLTYIEALRPFYPGLGQDRKWNGTTRAADVQHCPGLEEWPGFWAGVHKVIRECNGKEFRTLKPPSTTKEAVRLGHSKQTQQHQPLLSAVDVSNLLDITVGRPVTDILRSAYGTDAGFEGPRSAVPIGDPNRVLCVGQMPVRQKKTNMHPITRNKPLLIIDVKPSWVLYLPPHITITFNQQRHKILTQPRGRRYQNELIRAVSQMFAHMHINNVLYGVLTTYHSTYFFKRIDAEGKYPRLLVSPLIRRIDIGESSLVAAFVGLAVLASRQGHGRVAHGTPGPFCRVLDANPGTNRQHLVVDGPIGTQPLDGDTRRVRRSRGDPRIRVRIRLVEFLSRNLASTFRGVLEVGQVPREVVFKIYDLSIPEVADVCADELKAYDALGPIQGTIVPRIWAVGTLYGIYRVIAMDPCGYPVPEPPPPEFYEAAPALFRAIHGHNVVHNDIDLRNFLVSQGQYRVIDFNSAKIGTPAQIEHEERYLLSLLQKMKKGYIYRSQNDTSG